jgi:hypothetical protein
VVIDKSEIKKIVSPLLDLNLAEDTVKSIIDKVHGIYEEITGISGYNREEDYTKALVAEQGLAISINHTALCLKDHQRTAQFFRAVVAAITKKQQAYPGKIIRMLYTGCGPYAPFFTMIAPLFDYSEIQFTLLEINALSLEKAKDLTTAFGLEDYVHDYRVADAVTYKIPEIESYDILFSETLDAVLHRESFVPILLNLLPQVSLDTIIIPQNVILHACLIKSKDFPNGNSDVRDAKVNYPEKLVGEIFNVQEELQPFLKQGERPSEFSTKKFYEEDLFQFDLLAVYTEVQVLEDLWLKRGEGLLTEPLLKEIKKTFKDNHIKFTYCLQPMVEMKIES